MVLKPKEVELKQESILQHFQQVQLEFYMECRPTFYKIKWVR